MLCVICSHNSNSCSDAKFLFFISVLLTLVKSNDSWFDPSAEPTVPHRTGARAETGSYSQILRFIEGGFRRGDSSRVAWILPTGPCSSTLQVGEFGIPAHITLLYLSANRIWLRAKSRGSLNFSARYVLILAGRTASLPSERPICILTDQSNSRES